MYHSYSLSKDYDPDTQRAEIKKVKRKYKQELKSTSRELRREAELTADIKFKKRKLADEERKKRENEIM